MKGQAAKTQANFATECRIKWNFCFLLHRFCDCGLRRCGFLPANRSGEREHAARGFHHEGAQGYSSRARSPSTSSDFRRKVSSVSAFAFCGAQQVSNEFMRFIGREQNWRLKQGQRSVLVAFLSFKKIGFSRVLRSLNILSTTLLTSTKSIGSVVVLMLLFMCILSLWLFQLKISCSEVRFQRSPFVSSFSLNVQTCLE